MAITWTDEQRQVIELRNKNILVSAAAGSGKTAVLVERIVNKLLYDKVDIDRLLIVTFTRAAAGEMRERLTTKIEELLQENPDNEHLQRQQTLIHNAQINTIDGFCSYVIRNYFHTIDLDPGFRTADEGELKLMKYDVAKELLEQEYANATEEFRNFIEVFASGKSDDNIIELILKLYDLSMSNPWPKEWIAQCEMPYMVSREEQLNETESKWMEYLWVDVGHLLETAERMNQRFVALTLESGGPHMYYEAGSLDGMYIEKLKKLAAKKDFNAIYAEMSKFTFPKLGRAKKGSPAVLEEKKENAKSLRDSYKKLLEKTLEEKYFYGDTEQILRELEVCRGPVLELLRLTKEFIDAFAARKQKKNVLDFSDMEHYALDILVKKEGEQLIYSEAAEEFSRRFDEILIDEYQDSNHVQEELLQSVSRVRHGKYNIFMVGDVKQSIYRFRLARPELFMEKYEAYEQGEAGCQRIDLHQNFRSRAQVLGSVNYIFRQIMSKDLGGVEYDDAAALYAGAKFPEHPSADDWLATELLVADTDTELWEAESEAEQTAGTDSKTKRNEKAEIAAQELEARMVGTRILEIVGNEQVLDKKTGEYRPAQFRDCVILLRTSSGWSETFTRTLKDMGIPAYAQSRSGYFETLEIATMLNYLKICDNPMQEIPFTGILLSTIAGCTPEELALIKSKAPALKIYECVWNYRSYGENDELCRKLDRFLTQYEMIRSRVPYTPIHELILLILKVTGFGSSAAAMPGGSQRAANLEMLVEKAMEFEKTSYRGLFNFCRYMEQIRKYKVDFGEVNMLSEAEDTVRITTIHKSKGLEFPIVFVSGMGKGFNMQDVNSSHVLHVDLGIGTYGILPNERIKIPTLMRRVIQKKIRLETLGEEFRLLYVALTRAKEKLILTGTAAWQKRMDKYRDILAEDEIRLLYEVREAAKDYWDWVLPALVRHPVLAEDVFGVTLPSLFSETAVTEKDAAFCVRHFSAESLVKEEIETQISRWQQYQCLANLDKHEIFDKEFHDNLREKFSYEYPLQYLQEIPAKVSVSELKLRELEDAQPLIVAEKELVPIIPSFISQEEETLQGAARGTAYHRVLELLDYSVIDSVEAVQAEIERMFAQGKIDEAMRASVRASQIYWFANSWLGQRMKKAYSAGKLWREQQFIMSIPAAEMDSRWGLEEQVLVQGIVDAFFEEADGLVLVDYKTDRVQKGQEEELLEKYRKQLWYYARVLERVYKKPVKEVQIYAFSLGKSLAVKFC